MAYILASSALLQKLQKNTVHLLLETKYTFTQVEYGASFSHVLLSSAEASRASGCPLSTEVTITANRKRNQTISIRLTPTEKKEITAKAKQAQMTLTDYLIECSRNTEIKVTNLSEVLVELKHIGNNINQIARKVNSKRFFFGNFNSFIEGQRKIYDAILSLTGGD
nr:MobC family plasmid mobilization relaxosome protein [uncultured Ruminococcus sp.]